MNRFIFAPFVPALLTILSLGLSIPDASSSCAAPSSEQTPPNVVLLLIDNVGYGDIGCYGNPVIRTPHIDRLASQGVRCTDFYIVTSSCTPSRGALMTGRYPLRNGLTKQLSTPQNWTGIGLPHREKSFPQFLKDAGYVSGCFGKWNLGYAEGSRPLDRGFDEFFGCRSGDIDYYTHVYNGREDMRRNDDPEPVEVEGYSTDLFADAACDFIREQHAAKRPFFAYVPFNAAHIPNPKNKAEGEPTVWQAPAEFFEMYGYDADSTDPVEGYHAVMSALDAAIGRVVKQVDDLGISDNTIVLMMSDNGTSLNPNWPLETGNNGPFRGGRVEVYEGGVRTPFVVRWPGRIAAGSVCHEMVANIDVLPMVMTAAAIEIPKEPYLDGRDIAATLAGEARSPHEILFFEYHESSGARHSNAGTGSLRDAIDQANASANPNGVAIFFAETLVGKTIKLTSGELLLTNTTAPVAIVGASVAENLTLDSELSGGVILSGNRKGRVFSFGANTAAKLRNLTIRDGRTEDGEKGTGGFGGHGGGIYNQGDLSLELCSVIENVTGEGGKHVGGDGGYGGGI